MWQWEDEDRMEAMRKVNDDEFIHGDAPRDALLTAIVLLFVIAGLLMLFGCVR